MAKIPATAPVLEMFSGEPFTEPNGQPMPFGRVLLIVLDTPMKEPTASEIEKRLMLRAKLTKALRTEGKALELTADQTTLLKELVTVGINPPSLAGSVLALLDGKTSIDGIPITTLTKE